MIQLQYDWMFHARENQIAPNLRCDPEEYTWWLLLAGRGFGKSKAGSEWVRQLVFEHGYKEIACIGPSAREVRKIMVEGDSGIINCCAPWEKPKYHKSSTIQMLEWPNGAKAHLLTAENPDKIRGYNLDAVWMDELAAWPENQFEEAIYNVRMATRSPRKKPRFCVTTTPKPHRPFLKFYEEIKSLVEIGEAKITTGSTFSNSANLSQDFIRDIHQQYFDEDGTPTFIGRQEVLGEIIDNLDKRMWDEKILERAQFRFDQFDPSRELEKIVVSVDPSGTKNGDEVGIIAFGIRREVRTNPKTGRDERIPVGYVLQDASGKYSPLEWAVRVSELYNYWGASYVIGETNFGGDLVRQNIHAANPKIIFRDVKATKGKEIRAIPVANLYEANRIKHWVGNQKTRYRDLEKQMLQMTLSGYIGDGSPDRLDALIWAVHETMIKGMATSGTTDMWMTRRH